MLFNSTDFLIFFVIVYVVYWILDERTKMQNILLLFTSYIFYAWWDWRFLSLILISSLIDYTVGLKIYHTKSQKHKKNWLYISLLANLGLLGFFKYYNFFINSFTDLLNSLDITINTHTLNIILPVGISFYTFQTLSYTIDIYRGTLKPTKSVISFFTYIAFFPQLVAGPIERASNLLPQIEKKRNFKISYFKEGILQIFVGLLRKIVIADTLAKYVDTIYGNIEIYNSSTIILATVFYAFQIYYDFSGYSDIAIGTAKLLGFKFNQNFNLPYFSKSLTEFWRKWHMSLSYWLRDYLYISLGGNRKGTKKTYRNLLLTMLLGGLWHGSSWNFVIWGGIHGVVLSIEKYLKQYDLTKYINDKIITLFGLVITFSVVLFSWIFFRSQSIHNSIIAIKNIINFKFQKPFIGDINIVFTGIFVLLIGVLVDIYLHKNSFKLETIGSKYSTFKIASIISIIIVFISLFYSSSNNFIYFQF